MAPRAPPAPFVESAAQSFPFERVMAVGAMRECTAPLALLLCGGVKR
jgi:hypothetical protein